MGLTIHYSWQLAASRAEEIPALLDKISTAAKQLGFVEVLPSRHLHGAECDPDRADSERTRETLLLNGAGASELFVVETLPGHGCEAANFGFKREPEGRWIWRSFCKTQFAARQEHGGQINFLRSHTRLCKMLDAIRELGIDVEVHDDTDYFATRNNAALREAIDAALLVQMMLG